MFSNGFYGGAAQAQSDHHQSMLNKLAAMQNSQRALSLGVGTPAPQKLKRDTIEALKKAEPRMVTRRMPDGIVPGVAWRAWKVIAVDGVWKLAALGTTGVWEPKKALEATCNRGTSHPAPHRDCACGIWSFTDLDTLIPALNGYEVTVFGLVSIWGRVIECEKGFRSQFAYPKELWLTDSSMEQLGYVYGVPVRTL
jgi:hypothetical protein